MRLCMFLHVRMTEHHRRRRYNGEYWRPNARLIPHTKECTQSYTSYYCYVITTENQCGPYENHCGSYENNCAPL